MRAGRRAVTFGLMAMGLGACSGALTDTRAPSRSARGPAPGMVPVPNAGFDAWVMSFRGRAAGQGIAPDLLDRAFAGAGFLPGVVERDRNQTEFTRSLEDYLAIAASDEKVAAGRAMAARHAGTLAAIERRFGVAPHVVTAFWGLESNYGARRGDIPVVSALATLAYDGRRGAFFEQQLIAALKILQNGDVTPARMTGSWAGAMGHTQFIPTSYLAYAVDFAGDGRRDIWSDDPTDALASTASYLSRHGWQRGLPWGGEAGSPAAARIGAATLQPQAGGPRFAVSRNFDVIRRYNNSVNYAIGVGHLSDRIAGAGPLRASFPPDANGLTKDDRQLLQRRLTSRGFDTQGTDGVIGPNSEAAIRAYQQSVGLPATGIPSPELLARLA